MEAVRGKEPLVPQTLLAPKGNQVLQPSPRVCGHALDSSRSERGCFQSPAVPAVPGVAAGGAEPEDPEREAELTVVMKWLQGQPLVKRANQRKDEAEKAGAEEPVTIFWVEEAEAVPVDAVVASIENLKNLNKELVATPVVEGTPGVSVSGARKRSFSPGLLADIVRGIELNSTTASRVDKGQVPDNEVALSASVPPRSFLVACVVHNPLPKIKKTDEKGAARKKAEQTPPVLDVDKTVAPILKDLPEWPSPYAKNEVKTLRLTDHEQMREVGAVLNHEGIVTSFLKIEGCTVRLYPGDLVQLIDEHAGKTVIDIHEGRVKAPCNMKFLPCLRVSQTRVLQHGSYVDVHEQFVGFNAGRPKPSKGANGETAPYRGLSGLAADLRPINLEVQFGGVRAGGRTPRRIPGLSARRNPVQASTRGCH